VCSTGRDFLVDKGQGAVREEPDEGQLLPGGRLHQEEQAISWLLWSNINCIES
jgi:hypothetical protein